MVNEQLIQFISITTFDKTIRGWVFSRVRTWVRKTSPRIMIEGFSQVILASKFTKIPVKISGHGTGGNANFDKKFGVKDSRATLHSYIVDSVVLVG